MGRSSGVIGGGGGVPGPGGQLNTRVHAGIRGRLRHGPTYRLFAPIPS